jgi:hypothetical protein
MAAAVASVAAGSAGGRTVSGGPEEPGDSDEPDDLGLDESEMFDVSGSFTLTSSALRLRDASTRLANSRLASAHVSPMRMSRQCACLASAHVGLDVGERRACSHRMTR